MQKLLFTLFIRLLLPAICHMYKSMSKSNTNLLSHYKIVHNFRYILFTIHTLFTTKKKKKGKYFYVNLFLLPIGGTKNVYISIYTFITMLNIPFSYNTVSSLA